jgi:hypothetical protein
MRTGALNRKWGIGWLAASASRPSPSGRGWPQAGRGSSNCQRLQSLSPRERVAAGRERAVELPLPFPPLVYCKATPAARRIAIATASRSFKISSLLMRKTRSPWLSRYRVR